MRVSPPNVLFLTVPAPLGAHIQYSLETVMKTAMFALAAAAFAAPAATAQTEFNVSGGYSAFDGDGATLDAITARGALFFNENFGLEGEFSFGIGEDDLGGASIDGVSVSSEIELSSQFAGYVVGRLPLAPNFELLGRIGYGTAEFDVSATASDGMSVATASDSADLDGFAAGVGAQYFFTDSFGIRGDYTRFEADDDQIDGGLDTYTIAAVFRF